MTMVWCTVLGVVMTLGGLIGSVSGGHPHLMGWFGTNFVHNVFHLSLGIVALAAVAAGPRHTRYLSLALAPLAGLLATAGFLGASGVQALFNMQPADAWTYAAIAVTSGVLGALSPAPLRLVTAVDRPPVTWA